MLQKVLDYFNGECRPACGGFPPITLRDGEAFGYFSGLHLHSVFQPLFRAATLKPFAYEALLRVRDGEGNELPVAEAFRRPCSTDEVVHLDRLCRTIHAINFSAQIRHRSSLFLNLDGRHLLGVEVDRLGSTFEGLIGHCGLKPTQVVLEIIESRIDNLDRLIEAAAAYQERGFRVAIDDFGCQHSNFDRLWQLTPDIVKLDRSLIVQATARRRARIILPKLVEIIHDLGAQVVCEGIENREQHALAVDSGIDLLQGFYYAKPARRLPAASRRHGAEATHFAA